MLDHGVASLDDRRVGAKLPEVASALVIHAYGIGHGTPGPLLLSNTNFAYPQTAIPDKVLLFYKVFTDNLLNAAFPFLRGAPPYTDLTPEFPNLRGLSRFHFL
jgi:hypothetical protein